MKQKLIIDNIDDTCYDIIKDKVLEALSFLKKDYMTNYFTYDIKSQVKDGEIIRLADKLSKEEIIDRLENIIERNNGERGDFLTHNDIRALQQAINMFKEK